MFNDAAFFVNDGGCNWGRERGSDAVFRSNLSIDFKSAIAMILAEVANEFPLASYGKSERRGSGFFCNENVADL